MKYEECPHEHLVHQAVQSGQWAESVTCHVDACASCREVVQITQWIRTMAGASEVPASLPDPSLLWLKAQFLEQQAAREQAFQPLMLVGTVTLALATAIPAGALAWYWSEIQPLLTGDNPGSLTLLSLTIALFCTFMTLTAYPLIADE